MANDIAEYEPERGGEIAKASNSENLLAQIVEASKDPTVQPEKMQAMADLAIKLQDREMQQEFNRDYNAAIMEMPVITKGGRIVIKDKNTGEIVQSTPFAKFEDLDRVVKPIARRFNIAYSFDVGGDAQRLLVRVILRHRNGYVYESSAMPLPLETSGSKNNVQGAGSTNTYGKRYALTNAFAISTEGEDDDGNLGNTLAMPQERRNTVQDEAAAAFEAGTYDDWFRRQSPKDRAYMVQSGKHAEYGSTAALAAPEPKAEVEERQKVDPPKPEKEKVSDEDAARAEWVAKYVKKVDDAQALDTLAELQDKHSKNLQRIRDNYEDLAADIKAAHDRAMDRLYKSDSPEEAEETGDDLFGGDQ